MKELLDNPPRTRSLLQSLGKGVTTLCIVLGGLAILAAAALSVHYIVGMLYLSWMFAY